MASNKTSSFLSIARTRLGRLILPREEKQAPFLWPSNNGGAVSWGMGNFLSYVNEGFNLNSLIYAAIMYKVRAAAQVRLRAYTGDPDSPDVLPPNHPLSKLLARPNPYQSFAELNGLIIAYLNLAGNAYLYVDRDGSKNGVPMALYPLRPDRVYLIPGAGTIQGYLYRPPVMGQTEGIPILPEDMIHIKFPNLGDEYEGMGYGLSPMSPLAQSADVDNNATKFIKLFFERGGMPVGILKYNIPLELPQIQTIKQKWREVYGGVGNWTDIGVVDSAAEYQKLGQDFSKLGMDQMDARNETRILGPFGVPPILIGTKYGLDRSTYSNYEEARKAFWEDTMAYELRLELDSFSHFLYGNSGEFVQWDKSEVPALKQDIKDLTASAKQLFDMGVPASIAFTTVGLKIGEIPAGDLAFFSGSVKPWDPENPYGTPPPPPAPIVIGNDPNGDPIVPGKKPVDPNANPAKPGKKPPKGDPAQDNEGAAQAEGDTRKGSRQPATKRPKLGKFDADEDDHTAGELKALEELQKIKIEWTKSVDRNAVKEEPKYRKAARELFKEDERYILGLVSQAYKDAVREKKSILWGSTLTDIEGYLSKVAKTKWAKTFVPILRSTAIQAGKAWSTQLGVQFDVRNLEAENWWQEYAIVMAEPITKTTSNAMHKAIGEGMAEGLSVPQMQEKLSKIFAGYADYRTEAIARTESIRAYNAGSVQTFENWKVKEKEWSAADDNRTRPSHGMADGQVVGIKESFTIGGYQMDYPGDASHGAPPGEFVNCRCAVLPAGDLANLGKTDADRENTVDPEQNTDRMSPAEAATYRNIDPYSPDGKAFAEEWKNKLKSLSAKEQEALKRYSGEAYRTINKKLRGQMDAFSERFWKPEYDDTIKYGKAAFDSLPGIKENIITYRGAGWKAFGINVDDVLETDTVPGKLGKFVGTTLTDNAFVSTSLKSSVSNGFGGGDQTPIFEIKIPAGSKALYIDPISMHQGEYEVLLPPGTRFKITGINGNIVQVEYLEPAA